MNPSRKAPTASYGVLHQNLTESGFDEIEEQIRNLGYAILPSGYTAYELETISAEFDRVRERYIETHGETFLKGLDEINTVRALLTHGGEVFIRLALNKNLLLMLNRLIPGKFILNQQNGIINPPQEKYNQSAWHRDLPYQHFVSTKPLAVNALFCVDDFTFENGATFVLPASHKAEVFPSTGYVSKNAVQVEAKSGSFILLDCMMFHAGGFNSTDLPRRAVNHVFNIPFFKQQINIPKNMAGVNLSELEKDILGFAYAEPSSVSSYLATRSGKKR